MTHKRSGALINVFLLGGSANHYNIIRNLSNSTFELKVHVFAKHNHLSSSGLTFSIHETDTKEVDGLLSALLNSIKNIEGPRIIIPATDGELLFLEKNRAILSDYFTLSIPNSRALVTVSNKFSLQDVFQNNNLNYPKSIWVDKDSDPVDISLMSFPCIVKPVFSHEWKTPRASKIIGENKAIIIKRPGELSVIQRRVSAISSQLLIQEIIPQKNLENYSFCAYSDYKGNILHSFVTQKLIQYPDRFGTAVLCQTTNNTSIANYGKRAVKAFGLNGISETEIVIDKRTNKPFIIEVNPRHWMQHRLSTRLGVNYTLLDIYQRLEMQEKADDLLNKRSSQKQIIWIDDVGYIIYALKHFFHLKKCFIKEVLFKKREYFLFSFKDMKPFINTIKSKLNMDS